MQYDRSFLQTPRLILILASLSLLVVTFSTVSFSTAVVSPIILHDPNTQANGLFGDSTAIGNGLIVVGAPDETVGANGQAGHAYVFQKDGSLLRVLSSPNPQTKGYFGSNVAVGDGIIAVAALGENNLAGKVYVYNKQQLLFALTSPNYQSNGYFGDSVAIGEGVIVIGADGENNAAGNIYVFSENGVLSKTIASPNSQPSGSLGCCGIAVGQGVIVAGAPFESVGATPSAGHVYVFKTVTYSLLMTLTSPKPQADGGFGGYFRAVAIGDGVIVVGAYQEDNFAGHAYIFRASNGSLVASLASPNPKTGNTSQPGGRFGASVSEAGGLVSIAAPREDGASYVRAGYVYVYKHNGILQTTLNSPNLQSDGRFAGDYGLSVVGDTMVIGAFGEDNYAGNAYLFQTH